MSNFYKDELIKRYGKSTAEFFEAEEKKQAKAAQQIAWQAQEITNESDLLKEIEKELLDGIHALVHEAYKKLAWFYEKCENPILNIKDARKVVNEQLFKATEKETNPNLSRQKTTNDLILEVEREWKSEQWKVEKHIEDSIKALEDKDKKN